MKPARIIIVGDPEVVHLLLEMGVSLWEETLFAGRKQYSILIYIL